MAAGFAPLLMTSTCVNHRDTNACVACCCTHTNKTHTHTHTHNTWKYARASPGLVDSERATYSCVCLFSEPSFHGWFCERRRSFFYTTAWHLYSLMTNNLCLNLGSQWPDSEPAVGLYGPHSDTSEHSWPLDLWDGGLVKAASFAGQETVNRRIN